MAEAHEIPLLDSEGDESERPGASKRNGTQERSEPKSKSDYGGILCVAAAAGGVLAGIAGAYAVQKYLIANRSTYSANGEQSLMDFQTALKILGTAEPGQLLEIDRPEGYAHFCLYLGNGMVMNTKNDLIDGILEGKVNICEDKLEDVCDGDNVRIRNHDALAWEKCFALPKERAEIVASALEMEGKSVEYDVFGKNCEFYATLWRYGVGFSGQADYFPAKASNIKCME